ARPKKKWNHLQKYYHRGAYLRTFDDDDELANERHWDFSQPTLEDKFDKSNWLDGMQVKNIGRSVSTKYTNLADQDTTRWDPAWARQDGIGAAARYKMEKKMGGGRLERPDKRRKRT